jgi:pimeloyl-ACP methyl ester carboxylesterase
MKRFNLGSLIPFFAKILGTITIAGTGAAPVAPAADVPHPDVAVLFIGGFMTKEDNYRHYFEHLKEIVGEVHFHAVGQSPFNPDHLADYAGADKKISEIAASGSKKIVAMGFSAGGKHAARLALRRSEVNAVVLLDPVDGGPDPKGKTPIFLNDGDMINKPVALIRSEFGPIPKLFSKACAPDDVGPKHFFRHMDPNQVRADETLVGASHLNFIAKPWNTMFALACDNGNADADSTTHAIFEIFNRFLDSI